MKNRALFLLYTDVLLPFCMYNALMYHGFAIFSLLLQIAGIGMPIGKCQS